MVTADPSIASLRAQVRAIRKKAPAANVFGIFAPGRWNGPTLDGQGSEQIAIYQCDSALQMRLALQDAPRSASATILVTPLDQGKVSDDILLRLALRRLHPINNWEIVRSLFNARHLDPRISRHPVLAEMLLELAASIDFQPVAGGLVDADTVWGLLLKHRLGLSGAHPDVVELLRASAEADLAGRWRACPATFRSAAADWVSETAGFAAQTVLGCLEREHGAKALAIGLVMGVVYHETVGHELDKAAGRLESYVGTTNLPRDTAHRWRDAAESAVVHLGRPALRRCMDDAEVILGSIGAASEAWRSDHLDSGFEQRLTRLGQSLAGLVDARATGLSTQLLAIYSAVRKHRSAKDGGRRMDRCTMALRLSRWLVDRASAQPSADSGTTEFARRYAAEGSFVDWSRQVLRGGEPNKELAAAYVRLVDAVTDRRERENLSFAKTLVEERALGNPAAGLIPVEQLLDEVVAKAAQLAPVLLLIVDGMNWAVFRELSADILEHDWVELAMHPARRRLVGLAALPSVTEVSRTSLFCGKLRRGQAADEARGFATHPALLAASTPNMPPRLFHKAALEGDEDTSLAGDLRQAIADKRQRVVGVVINAVDDHLDKGDQIDSVWTTEHIRVLEPILAEAGGAGRLIVMLSDHGHVLDRQTNSREATDGLRWRRPGAIAGEGELELTSPRVVMPDGGRVVVPWSERLRYGPKKNGYHGGATPQEMLIPVAFLWPRLDLPEKMLEMPSDVPAWWSEPTVVLPSPAAPLATLMPTETKPQPPTLFDETKTISALVRPAEAPEPWIAKLLASEVFVIQKKFAGRARIDEGLLQRLLDVLASRGGSMTAPALASAAKVPEHRLPGLLAVLQRVLNVEGYAILDRQDASNTVVLNVPLLKKQFELPE